MEFCLVYTIPEVVTEPPLDTSYKAVKYLSKLIVDTTKGFYFKIYFILFNFYKKKTFFVSRYRLDTPIEKEILPRFNPIKYKCDLFVKCIRITT